MIFNRQAAGTLLLASLAGLLAFSCKEGETDDGTGGDAAGGSEPTSSVSSQSVTTGGACSLDPMGDACNTCIASTCCDAHVACEADPVCWGCVTGTDPDACGSNQASHDLQTAYLECYGGPCNEACIGASGDCTEASEVYEPACGDCLETNCCEALGACFAHEGCWIDCVTDHNPEGCHEPTAHALFYALGSCAQESCEEACSTGPDFEPVCTNVPATAPSAGSCVTLGGTNECNPVTNEGCTEAGYACDLNQAGDGFVCYEPPNTQALCQMCGANEGWCAPGHTCAGSCVRYCCTSDDCGPDGACDLEILDGVIGLCVLPPP